MDFLGPHYRLAYVRSRGLDQFATTMWGLMVIVSWMTSSFFMNYQLFMDLKEVPGTGRLAIRKQGHFYIISCFVSYLKFGAISLHDTERDIIFTRKHYKYQVPVLLRHILPHSCALLLRMIQWILSFLACLMQLCVVLKSCTCVHYNMRLPSKTNNKSPPSQDPNCCSNAFFTSTESLISLNPRCTLFLSLQLQFFFALTFAFFELFKNH